MNFISAVLIYVLLWWMAFFVVLPIGVRSQAESEDVSPGTEPGAPVNPELGRKLLLATAISGVLFVLVAGLILFGPFSLDAIWGSDPLGG